MSTIGRRAGWWLSVALAGWGWGCDRPEPAATPGPEPVAQAPAAAAEGDRHRDPLADALVKARTVDELRRDLVTRLPDPAPTERSALKQRIDDADAAPAGRLAALTALGGLAPPERALAVRTWLNEAVGLPTSDRLDSALAVTLIVALHPPAAEAYGAFPAHVTRILPATRPGVQTAWVGSMAAHAMAPPTVDDIPLLVRLALSEHVGSPRLAWLLLATLDDPAATEALLLLPAADLGEPRPGAGLTGWALALHATLPGARERLKIAANAPGRGGDRATATLTWLGDPAARAPAVRLLDRLARHGAEPPPYDFEPGLFIEGAGRLAADADAGAELALALARYAESGAPLARRAHSLAGPAGVSRDRDKLFDRIAADPSDPRVRRALLPLLRAEDGPRLAALLVRERWGLKGFFHHVRMVDQATAEVLTAEVVGALVAVAGEHPDSQTREWALGALAEADGPLPAVVEAAAAKGSKAAVRTLVTRAEDPWAALWSRASGDDDAVRRAAYEMLIAPRLLPFEPSAEQAAQILGHIAGHLLARPEEPWIFLRAARHYVEPAGPALTPAAEKALARALRPYCVTSGPDGKPWWDALFTVGSLSHGDAKRVIADAVKSVPTAGGRRVMRERMGLPPDPADAPPAAPPPPKRPGGHWADPSKAGGHR